MSSTSIKDPIEQAAQLRRAGRWAFVLAAICSFGAVAFLLQFLEAGTVHLPRENVTLSGLKALTVPGAALLGAIGFSIFGVRFWRKLRRLRHT